MLVFVGWLVVGWFVGWFVAVLELVLVLCFVGVGVVLIVLVPWLVGWLVGCCAKLETSNLGATLSTQEMAHFMYSAPRRNN